MNGSLGAGLPGGGLGDPWGPPLATSSSVLAQSRLQQLCATGQGDGVAVRAGLELGWLLKVWLQPAGPSQNLPGAAGPQTSLVLALRGWGTRGRGRGEPASPGLSPLGEVVNCWLYLGGI